MLAIQKFLRFPIINYQSSLVLRKCSTKSGGSDDQNNQGDNKKDAINKLNALLKRMVEEDVSNVPTTNLNLAKAKKSQIINTEAKTQIKTKTGIDQKVIDTVKNVAEDIGGNVKQTESELLNKLLHTVNNDQKSTPANLNEIVRGMKIDRETKAPEALSRAQQVKMLLQHANELNKGQKQPQKRPSRKITRQDEPIQVKKIDLFGSNPLGIFSSASTKPTDNINTNWKALHERELRLAVTHPPANYFQEMILWTEQGKLWKFPIDNEQGLGEEKDVYFAEHVFLDKHLETWCPTKGPIRHFMELVCVGLSKNPYLSVKNKKEHIEWYRDYFNEKKQLLKDVGAIQGDHEMVKEISDK